jgi:hypothetical protein
MEREIDEYEEQLEAVREALRADPDNIELLELEAQILVITFRIQRIPLSD